MKRMSSLTKDSTVKSLEYTIIMLVLDPNDVHATLEIIKNRNVDIQSLRKRLKLPTTEHPQAQEVGELMKEK